MLRVTSAPTDGSPALAGRDMISVRDFSKEEILSVLRVAKRFESETRPLLAGKVMATLFYEPSTRTRLSFESAMKRLGGATLGFSDMKVSSTTKGESLQDTIKVVEGYCDAILIRHPLEGAARVASEATIIPVINGGDGTNQHPTQTLLDLYTIQKTRGTLEGLKVAFLGDLRYGRTVHSLIEVLASFDAELFLAAPQNLNLPEDMIEDMDEASVRYSIGETLDFVDRDIDVLYTTRIQKERFADPIEYERVQNAYQVDRQAMDQFEKEVTLMHPLPRVNEIHPELDAYPGSAYFQQAHNGVIVRQAILSLLLGECGESDDE